MEQERAKDRSEDARVGAAELAGVRRLEAWLRRARARARWLLVGRALAMGVAAAIAAVMVGGLIDFVLRSPAVVRGVGLAGAAGLGALGFWRYIWPALRFCPTLPDVALRVEGQPEGEGGELRGYLAAALELADDDRHGHESRVQREAAIAEALRRFGDGSRVRLHRVRPMMRALGVLGGALVVLSLVVVTEPTRARIGVERMLLPWTGAEWPKRQLVEDITSVDVQAVDMALALRAAVVRTNRGEGRTPVRMRYRGVSEAGVGEWRSAMLTSQERRVDLAEAGLRRTGSGELYERLVDPLEVVRSTDASMSEGWIEYWFETEDDETVTRRVRVVSPPSVVLARVSVFPPAYALAQAEGAGLASGVDRDLGRGQDERAVVERVLAGSRIEFEIAASKALGGGDVRAAGWLADLLARGRDVEARTDGARLTISGILDGSVRLNAELVDEFGLRNRDEAVFSFDVVSDREPEVVMMEPGFDEQVLSSAVVAISGQARDDLGVVELRLERQVAKVPSGSTGASPEPTGVWEETSRRAGEIVRDASVHAVLDVAALGVGAGDEVWLSAVGSDTLAASGGGERGEVRSSIRRLRVISETELTEQIRAELGGLRQTAMRLDEQQARLIEQLSEEGASEDVVRQQSELTDRIGAQQSTLDRLEQRRIRNGLEDGGLEAMLEAASEAIARAAEASGQAASTAGEASRGEAEREDVREDQQAVRDALAEVVEQLDRGEDGWVARRALERALEEQREVTEQTRRAGEKLIGRDRDELTPEERTELDRIADRQRQAARQAAEAIEELAQRAQQMQDSDGAQAAAMAEAARRGQQQQVAEQLEQAARDIEQNRTQNAGGAQQQAVEALEQMLEELDTAQRRRNAALLRQLASLADSIEGLIEAQQAEIDAVGRAIGGGAMDGLDRAMIRLRDNTLAVQVMASEPEMERVADLLGQAAGAQGVAIGALRRAPADLAAAEERERESLLKLEDARAETDRLAEQAEEREREEQVRELREQYVEVLEEQIRVRDETGALTGRELSRRERADARALGERQEAIRTRLADLLTSTAGLVEAGVFEFAHRRLDEVTRRASEGLGEGEASGAVVRAQAEAVELLQTLAEVLADAAARQGDFDEGADGAGGGGQGGGGGGGEGEPMVPPIAELRLLRAMQAAIAGRTRAAHEGGASDDEIEELGRLQDELAKQAAGLIERLRSE